MDTLCCRPCSVHQQTGPLSQLAALQPMQSLHPMWPSHFLQRRSLPDLLCHREVDIGSQCHCHRRSPHCAPLLQKCRTGDWWKKGGWHKEIPPIPKIHTRVVPPFLLGPPYQKGNAIRGGKICSSFWPCLSPTPHTNLFFGPLIDEQRSFKRPRTLLPSESAKDPGKQTLIKNLEWLQQLYILDTMGVDRSEP